MTIYELITLKRFTFKIRSIIKELSEYADDCNKPYVKLKVKQLKESVDKLKKDLKYNEIN